MTAVERSDEDVTLKPLSLGMRAAVLTAAIIAVAAGGATPIATKFAVLELDPLLVGLLRTVLAAFVALPLILVLRVRPPRSRRHICLLALSASCAFIGFPVIFGFGQSLTSTAHSGLIYAAIPILVGVFASMIEGRAPSRAWWVGGAIAFAGEAFLIAVRGGAEGGGATLAGDALVLASIIVLSLGYVIGSRLTQEGYSAWGATFWGLVAGGIVLAPFVPLAATGTGWRDAGAAAWSGVAFLVLGSSILAYICLYWSFGKGGIAKTGMLYFIAPVITLALAVLMLGETLSAPLLVAAGVILAGVYLSQRQ